MMDICYFSIATSSQLSTISTSNVITNIDSIVNIVVNILVIYGGILGLQYIKKMREKQVDSTFSYLTKLNIRLKYFYEILSIYGEDIMDRFVPAGCRREIAADRVCVVDETIKRLSSNATETLGFLKNEDNQMPAEVGWTTCFNKFIEFLIDCEQINENNYFKWMVTADLEQKKKKYYDTNLTNIDKLLQMVCTQQCKVEEDIFKHNSQ